MNKYIYIYMKPPFHKHLICFFFTETFSLEVVFVNPLRIPLNLLDLHLLWEFTPSTIIGQDNITVSNKVCKLLD